MSDRSDLEIIRLLADGMEGPLAAAIDEICPGKFDLSDEDVYDFEARLRGLIERGIIRLDVTGGDQ